MYNRSLYVLLILVVNTLTIPCLFAQETSSFEMSYFEDTNGAHSFASVKQENFIPTQEHLVNLGITKSTLWIKLSLNTKVLDPETVLIIDTPFKDHITLSYTTKDLTNVTKTLGIMHPHSKNEFNHYVPTFKVPIQDLASQDIFIKVTSRWSMMVPVKITSKETFYKERTKTYFIGGLLIGGLLLMAIYNLFLFFSTRDFSYVLYVLALLGAILSQGYIFGIIIPYLSPEWPEFSFRFPLIIMAFTGIFCSWFAIRFLNLKQTSKGFYYVLIVAILFAFLNICLELLHLDYLSRKMNILLVIGNSMLILLSAVYSLIKGNKIAIYFTIAWTVYLSGMIVFALKTVGIIPHNAFTAHFMHLGTFMEVVLLSFALGHKYSLIRIEKERLEHQTRAELEQLVKQQTQKLETSLEEKEVLLKEIHHRVKNNLQIVISLLDLQVASIKDEKNKAVLAQSKSRVYSMSLIHKKLYQSNNLAQINMKNYLEELFSYVQNSYFNPEQTIEYSLLVEDKNLSITKAVPLGLIVNELLTNSFKYGITKQNNNHIKLALNSNNKVLTLIIADSGIGFKENNTHYEVKKSLGLFLVKSLTKQLHATINRYHENNLFITALTIPTEE